MPMTTLTPGFCKATWSVPISLLQHTREVCLQLTHFYAAHAKLGNEAAYCRGHSCCAAFQIPASNSLGSTSEGCFSGSFTTLFLGLMHVGGSWGHAVCQRSGSLWKQWRQAHKVPLTGFQPSYAYPRSMQKTLRVHERKKWESRRKVRETLHRQKGNKK